MDFRHGAEGTVGIVTGFRLVFRPVKDQFHVRLGRNKKEFTIDPKDKNSFVPFYDFFFNSFKEYFEKNAQDFLDPGAARKFGFAAER